MKTIKQLADEIGVTKNAIVMKIKRNPDFAKLIQEHTNIVDNITFIDNEGEYIIKANVKCRNNTPNVTTNSNNNVSDNNSTVSDNNDINAVNVIANILSVSSNITNVINAINEMKDKISIANAEIMRLSEQVKANEQQIKDLKQQIIDIRADKDNQINDLKQNRDKLTSALMLSKSDLARLENIIVQVAALPLKTRIFGWSGAITQLTNSNDEIIEISDEKENENE